VPFRSEKKGNERSCQEEEKEGPMGRLPGEKMNHIRLWKVVEGMNVGDEKTTQFMWEFIVNPYQTTSISWKVSKSFFLFYCLFRAGANGKWNDFFVFFRGT